MKATNKTPLKTAAETKTVTRKPNEEKDGSQKITVDEKIYFERNCHMATKHSPHTWKSYLMEDKPQDNNSFCDGSGKSPSYVPNKTYTPKKDYSEDQENFPTSNPITLTQARKIAYDMHKNQKDKVGEPYKLHLNAVQKGVVILGGDEEEQIAALFHDAVEDFHTSYDLLRKIHVTENTITMIEAVSKRTSEEQGKYLQRVIDAGEGAMRVKLADLLHNTRHDRLEALTDHTRTRLLKKYRPAMTRLMLELNMIATEDSQKALVTKPVGSATGGYSWSSTPPKSLQGKSKKTMTTKQMSVTSLVVGDWVKGWSAPVISTHQSKNDVTITLADGRVKSHTVYFKVSVWEKDTWAFMPEADIEVDGFILSDEDIADFLERIDPWEESISGEQQEDNTDAQWETDNEHGSTWGSRDYSGI